MAENAPPEQEEGGFSVGEGTPTGEFHQMTDEELAARNKRNLFVALAIVAFIVIVFLTTVLRLTQNIGASAP